jgi:hypothetical protein
MHGVLQHVWDCEVLQQGMPKNYVEQRQSQDYVLQAASVVEAVFFRWNICRAIPQHEDQGIPGTVPPIASTV